MLDYLGSLLAGLLIVWLFGVPAFNSAGHLLDTAIVLRALPSNAVSEVAEATDGDAVAIEGEVVVNEPAGEADRLVDQTDETVGLYVWRTVKPDMNNTIDVGSWTNLDSWSLRETRRPLDSGVEWGQFSVHNSDESLYVDPTWLREQYNTVSFPIEMGGWVGIESARFRHWVWSSPALRLTGDETTRTFDQIPDLFENIDATKYDDYHLNSRPVRDGDTVTVLGRYTVENGERVIRGGDGAPLAISDQGLDEYRRYLRRRLLKHGLSGVIAVTIPFALFILF
ncbi:hypothetical protein C440_01520 [Haloferax mucosum ATCC BAA-1512]|uniref:Uncharacterized protein n=1 Tax=Haloferax mucosum ATCC BAA-1512 TaxID=662479 RepID=M0IU68_9EURY|nr:hypothetical protein [Haloferax mucosum]ELZ98994.1 hypothetical protein C440_01520 [Haloferax mucosum ATCC BAA-1512]